MHQPATFGGGVAPAGSVLLRPIRTADLPKTREFQRVPGRRLGRAERELLRLQAVFARMQRGDQVAAEAARLEEFLGIVTSQVGLHRDDAALRQYFRVLAARAVGRMAGAVVMDSQLRLIHRRPGLDPRDLGIVSRHVVTTAGVNAIVDAFQNTVELENFKFHGIGTGVGGEVVGDTALGTELTTEYNPDGTRATGSTEEGGAANKFRTDGTNTLDSGTPAVTEHGVFTQATVGGTLLDRSVFAAINLNGANGDGLRSIYDLTLTAGS